MPSQDLIPLVGMKGVWQFTAPLNEVISATAVFECMAVRKLSDVIASGENAYERYYKSFGISNEQYVQDVRNGVCIISLCTATGLWQYVPSNKIAAFPVMTGVKYSNVVLGVAIGEIPENLDLTALVTKIRNVTQDYTSLVPTVNVMVASSATLKSKSEHDRFLSAIAASRQRFENDYSRANAYQAELVTLRAKLAIAEQYILAHPVVPTP